MKKISFILVSATVLGTALLTTTAHAGEKGAVDDSAVESVMGS